MSAARPRRGRVHLSTSPAVAGRQRPLSDRAARAAVRSALARGGREGIELSVVFVSDLELAQMHGRWLGDDRPTDVIAFDLGEEHGGAAGEIYVSLERAERHSAEHGLDPARELALYLVHGALHLCGHDDREARARARMRAAEAEVLDGLGYAREG